MDTLSLPARIGYAVVALPLGGVAGFYCVVWLVPKLTVMMQLPDIVPQNYATFVTALFVGGAAALTASLVGLTLPWKRPRKRRGRPWRIGLSAALVVLAAAAFADQGHTLVVDLAFAGWLAYAVTFTLVRYGVLDQARRKPARSAPSDSARD